MFGASYTRLKSIGHDRTHHNMRIGWLWNKLLPDRIASIIFLIYFTFVVNKSTRSIVWEAVDIKKKMWSKKIMIARRWLMLPFVNQFNPSISSNPSNNPKERFWCLVCMYCMYVFGIFGIFWECKQEMAQEVALGTVFLLLLLRLQRLPQMCHCFHPSPDCSGPFLSSGLPAASDTWFRNV